MCTIRCVGAHQRKGDPSVDAKHLTPATFPAGNPPECSVFQVLLNRSLPPKGECLSTQPVYHNREETALTPALKGGASAPENGDEAISPHFWTLCAPCSPW